MKPVGIGLRDAHVHDLKERAYPSVGWLEILADNYIDADEETLKHLDILRTNYPFSLHSVGSSIGSVDPLNTDYLKGLKRLIDRYDPFTVSEHLCWSGAHGVHLHDLFPLPMNNETVDHVVSRVSKIQELFGRTLLIENVSTYTTFPESTMTEPEFITEIAQKSGSQILLDINNIFINAENLNFSAKNYLEQIPPSLVSEFHLAGGEVREDYILDSHSCPVWDEVWELYSVALDAFGVKPTLIEWDNDIPPIDTLLLEVEKATERIAQINHSEKHSEEVCAA